MMMLLPFAIQQAFDPARKGALRKWLPVGLIAGASTTDLIALYDASTENEIKDAILSTLVESGEKQATDKLMVVAGSDDNAQRRRRAISMLSRSSDERVKKFLSDLANQR